MSKRGFYLAGWRPASNGYRGRACHRAYWHGYSPSEVGGAESAGKRPESSRPEAGERYNPASLIALVAGK